jgi:tRNA A-37 threonylcarbamoyl transferase component Bud32
MAKHGRYKIVRRVADGGMAEIFLATQMGRDGFQKPVILKRIHSTIYADPQFRNMFIDEAHISMSLQHSNIVQVYDLGVSAGRYFLVLELVDGWDLGRILHRAAAAGTRLPRELALYIVADVCRALAYAHSKAEGDRPLGIVHRDISTHNILVSDQGEVKLTDFGIAKAMNKREQTGTGVVKGKVAFMSPEQAMGKPIDARSDLFSLGTVLYLLMTRSRPFEGPTELETLLRVQKGDFTAPEATAPDLEPQIAGIIHKAMRHNPAERYQSAEEMLTDLEHVSRTVLRPVGQTELKRWLAELTAQDGQHSISKAPERPAAIRAGAGGTGSGELEGHDVVLESEDEAEEEDVEIGKEATSLAVVDGGRGGSRLSRQRTANELPISIDDDGAHNARGRRLELVLPVPEGDEPPARRRLRSGGGFSKLLFVGALLVGGAWAAGKYARHWFPSLGGRPPTVAAPAARPADQGAAAPAPEAQPAGPTARHEGGRKEAAASKDARDRASKEAAEAKHAKDTKEPKDTDDAAGKEAAAKDSASEKEPAHDGANRRSRERANREAARRGPDLKGLMAPDPSQLSAPPPAPPAPAPAEAPPAQETP